MTHDHLTADWVVSIAANSSRVALREFDVTTAVVGNSNAITGTGTLYVSGVYPITV